MLQFATRPSRTPSSDNKAATHPVSVRNSHLAQLAATLSASPRTQALIQRKSQLGRPLPTPKDGVIQCKTKVKYTTQSVNWVDEANVKHVEKVGHIADAWIDAHDPIVGTGPNSEKQQKPMYSALKRKYNDHFVRGHLLNDHVGGVGEIYNLFPITKHANGHHLRTAEGFLKKYLRTELGPKDPNDKIKDFVHYRVFAVPANPNDLMTNANAEFRCEMVAAHSLQEKNGKREKGASETWTVYSTPGSDRAPEGKQASSSDVKNVGLGRFGAKGTGEHASSEHSRKRSSVDGWKGNKDHKFAETRFEDFSQLSDFKNEMLENLEDALDKFPVFSDILIDTLAEFRKALKTAHDEEAVRQVAESTKLRLHTYGCQRFANNFLDTLRNWLTPIPITVNDKAQIWNHAKLTLQSQKDLFGLYAIDDDLTREIREKVNSLLQTDEAPKQEPMIDDPN